jgi:hypothetical protein
MSEAAKEVKLIYYLLHDISIEVNLQILVKLTMLAQFLCSKVALLA